MTAWDLKKSLLKQLRINANASGIDSLPEELPSYEESFCNHEQFVTKWDVCVHMNACMHFLVSLPLSKISHSYQFGSVQDVHKLYLRNTVWVGLYHKCAAHSLY